MTIETISELIHKIDNNINAEENVKDILKVIKEDKIDENVILEIIEKSVQNKIEVLNFIAMAALNGEMYDIIIPFLQKAYELDCTNIDINYNLAYVINLFGEGTLALEYLLKLDTENEKISELKLTILRSLSESEVPENQSPKYYIAPSCDIRGRERMEFEDNVIIQEDCWLDIAYNNPNQQIMIEIKKGANIGRRSELSAANKIIIGEFVLIGPNVFISDCGHEYSDINTPIIHQGITSTSNEVHIGSGSWIGINSVINGNIRIGKNCVVGANSIVNKDIPDYSVVVGSPAKIIKMFDTLSNKWIVIKRDEEIKEILDRRELAKYKIPFENLKCMQVEVSSVCNIKCPQCPNNLKEHKSKILSRDMWNEKIRPSLKNLTDIHLVGIGEPLLCKDFFDYVEECVEMDIIVHTTSNLQLVNEELAKKIVNSGITNLSFSCDGATAETYEKIRVNGNFEKLIKNINLINKYKKEYNSKLPNLILNFGALECNIRELPNIIEFAKKLNVDQVIAYHDIIYFEELNNQSLYFNQDLSDQMFEKAEALAKEYNIGYFHPGTFNNPIKYNECRKEVYCAYPFAHLWIYSDGRVGPCCMDFPKRIMIGDLNIETMEEIWNNKSILELRKDMTGNVREECKWCGRHGKLDLTNEKFLFKYDK